jgi:hypothetical protein
VRDRRASLLEQSEPVQRERRLGERPDGELHQHDAVQVDRAAPATAVHDGPLAVTPAADADGLHGGVAARRSVAGHVVDVPAPEAARTVVSVCGARRLDGDVEAAVPASEGARTAAPPGTHALVARQLGTSKNVVSVGTENGVARLAGLQPERRDVVCSVAAVM